MHADIITGIAVASIVIGLGGQGALLWVTWRAFVANDHLARSSAPIGDGRRTACALTRPRCVKAEP
jgi:hypothetical protein